MKNSLFYAVLITAVVLSSTSLADVLVKSVTTMDQLLGIGSSKSETSVYIKGDKNRTDSRTSFDSPIFKLSEEEMNFEKTEIFRLDKDVKWELNRRNNSYREIYLRSLKPEKTNFDDMNSPPDQSPGSDIEDYFWIVKIDIANAPETVNSFESIKALMNAIGVNREDRADSMFVELNVWKCEDPELFGDVERYQEKFSEIAGFEGNLGLEATRDYASGFGDKFEAETRKIEEMKGYPVKTILLIQKSTAGDGGEGKSEISDLMEDLVAGSSRGDNTDRPPGPRITILSLTNEVVSVDNSPIDDGMFEIPEGYIKE